MIQYSRMTLKEAVDEVLLRMGQHRTAINLDWDTIAMFVNRAIRETLTKTLPYKEWCYMSTLKVTTNPFILPTEANGVAGGASFMSAIRLVLPHRVSDDLLTYTEARQVDAKEFFTLSDWYKGHSWNAAKFKSPIYCLWGSRAASSPEAVQTSARLYVAPFSSTVFSNMPDFTQAPFTTPPMDRYVRSTDEIVSNDRPGLLDCILAPARLTSETQLVPVPYEFENLVILYALARALAKVNAKSQMVETVAKATEETARVAQMYAQKRATQKLDLESFVDPVMPSPAIGGGN